MDTPKMLFTHSVNAYAALKRDADVVDGKLIWTGFMTHVIRNDLNLSVPYYSQILKALKRMGCVEQLRRGGSSTPSQWLLVREPTEELFESSPMRVTTRTTRLDAVEQQCHDLSERIDMIEALLRQGLEIPDGNV
jgi:hypothetical protein